MFFHISYAHACTYSCFCLSLSLCLSCPDTTDTRAISTVSPTSATTHGTAAAEPRALTATDTEDRGGNSGNDAHVHVHATNRTRTASSSPKPTLPPLAAQRSAASVARKQRIYNE